MTESEMGDMTVFAVLLTVVAIAWVDEYSTSLATLW